MEQEYKLNEFIKRESLNNLSICIGLVVAMTEVIKGILTNVEPRIIVLITSILISFARMYLNLDEKNIKDEMIIAFFNVIPISIGAIGAYDMIIKVIMKSIGG